MNATLRWLLGLRTLLPGQAGVEFGFEHPLPGWAWALTACAAAALAFAAYRRLEGPLWARFSLGTLRATLLMAVAVALSGPRLLKPNETEERDWVLVLVDRSASLSVPDAPAVGPGSPAQARTTREQQLRAALEASRPVWRSLAAERVLVWLGFDSGAYELPVAAVGEQGEGLPKLGEAVGRRTDLAHALDQALKRASARPLSGVVVISDGRSVEEPARSVLRGFEAQRVPIFTVALGSAKGVADWSVKRVDAPRSAFVRDTVPVQVEVQRTGPAGAEAGGAATVELVDQATGAVLDSRAVDPGDTPEPGAVADPGAPLSRVKRVTLMTRPSASGPGRWLVRVRPPGGPDMIEANDAAPVSVELVDRPLRIAYFDGYPRWEYRYLKNLLVRERSVSSVVMLLAPGRRYLQEGTVTLDALPRSPEEWANFDVFVMGDVWPGVFTRDQLEQMAQRVAVGGAGLIWIAGEGATPLAWRSTPLADLLPFSLGEASGAGAGAGLAIFDGPVTMRPTPAADRVGVLRLSETDVAGSFWPAALSDPATGWSLLRWMQRIDPAILKPAAEVLAVAQPAGDTGSASPAVISLRFGAGRSLYVATDEIWRWRYGQGDRLAERFWVQLIRLLGRESLARSGRSAILEVTPERGETARPVRVSLTLLDQALVDAAPASIHVRIRKPAGAGTDERVVAELPLGPEGQGASPGKSGATRTYASTWLPPEPGRYIAECVDPLITSRVAGDKIGGSLATTLEVFEPDDEMRQPQADHALLARLSLSTGGQALRPDQLTELPKLLPNRKLRLAGDPDVQTLWDSPLALLILITLLTAEWVGRRLLRLV